jgi:cell division protein FtsI (penicillin-binding protein 3)
MRGATPRLELPGWRAGLVFGGLALLFAVLAGRSLYLQGFEDEFLQGQGKARYAREIEVPAHRGRIVDRHGEALAVSTPVKSLWAFPDKLDGTQAQWAALAKLLEISPQALKRKIAAADDFVYLARRLPPEVAERALALRITGLYDENEYRRYYPGGEVMGHVLGFTGDRDVGQEGIELAQQEWLGGRAGSRRVIINRRGDVVEDVASVREPQAGRELALSLDTRLK